MIDRYRYLRQSGPLQAPRESTSPEDPLHGGRDQTEASGAREKRDHGSERSQASLRRKHVSFPLSLIR